MTMTREQVEALLSRAPEGPWRADGEPWNRIVWSGAENRVCFMAHSNGLNDDRDVAASDLAAAAPDLARALLAALDDLDAVKAERGVLKAAIEQLHGPLSVAALVARAEAAETALAAVTAREERLREALADAAGALDSAGAELSDFANILSRDPWQANHAYESALQARAALQHKDDTHGPE